MIPRDDRQEQANFSIVIIHNGDEARLSTTAGSLSVFLGSSWRSSTSKILEKQPPFTALSRKFVVKRTLYSLGIALTKQSRLKKPLFGYLQVLLEHMLLVTQTLSPMWSKLQKRVFAELALTQKHISALEHISQNGLFGLVVEDDIQLADEFDLTFDELQSIPTGKKFECLYVSLCVAFTLQELGIQNSVQEGPPKFLGLAEGVANTTAAYWITKEFADRILSEIESDSKLKLLAADWLITEAFSRVPEAKCLYVDKGVFVNGSLFGLSNSEIRL
jgi:hypothetical protein